MSFIDNQHAKRIEEWSKQHPEESKAYFAEHQKLSTLFIQHKIAYHTFHKRSEELKEKYQFLGVH